MWGSEEDEAKRRCEDRMQMGDFGRGADRRVNQGLLHDDSTKAMAYENDRSSAGAIVLPLRVEFFDEGLRMMRDSIG